MRITPSAAAYFCLALLLALAVVYFPYLIGQTVFYRLDASCFFEPLCTFFGDHIRQGRFPLWNPLAYCGMPQIALSSPGSFYPPNLIFALLPFSNALALVQIFHQFIAGLGMYLLISRARWGVIPAVVAGASYALCGYMFSQYWNYTLMATAAWLPLCAWGLQSIGSDLDKRNVRAIAVCAVCVFGLIAAGRPEVWLPGLVVLGVLVLVDFVRARREPDRIALKELSWRVLAIGLGILFSMPGTLPLFEWSARSPREHGLAWIEVLGYSANWYDFVGFMLNSPLGDLEAFGAKFAPLVVNPLEQFPLASSVFVGPIVITLALWGLFESGWKWRWLLLFGAVFFSFMAAGKNSFFAGWMVEHLGKFVPLRYPAKLLIFPAGFLAILAARGAYTCFRPEKRKGAQIAVAVYWTLVLVKSLLCVNMGRLFFDPPFSPLHGVDTKLGLDALSVLGRAGIEAAVIGLVTCAFRAFFTFDLIRKPVFASFIVAIPAGMLLAAGAGTLSHGTSPDFYTVTSKARETVIAQFADNKQIQYRYMPFIYFPPTPPSAVPGSDWTVKYYQYKRQVLLPNQVMDCAIPCSVGYESTWTVDHKRLMDAVGNTFVHINPSDWFIKTQPKPEAGGSTGSDKSPEKPDVYDRGAHQLPLVRFCKLTATRFVLTPNVRPVDGKPYLLKILDPAHFTLVGQFPETNARLYTLRNPLSRAYFARTWATLSSYQELIDLLLKKQYDEYDPAKCSYLDTDAAGKIGNQLPHMLIGADEKEPEVKFQSSEDDSVLLAVRADKPGLLVLADTPYPGWEAQVDGNLTEIFKANLLNRAIIVPSGSHVVRFQYKPKSLLSGIACAGAGIAILAALFILALARRKS